MPFPLIPIAIVTVVALVAAALAVPRIIKTLSGKSVAVLGGRSVGKTTLLYLLQHRKLPESSDDAAESVVRGEFELAAGKASTRFTVHRDISEHPGDGGFKIWKDTFSKVDHVWYLFRADLIAQRNPAEVTKVKSHLDLFAAWLGDKNVGRPKVMLIGTWADADPRYQHDSTSFRETVATSSPIQLGMVKLEHSTLIVGSLRDKKESDRLLRRIESALNGK